MRSGKVTLKTGKDGKVDRHDVGQEKMLLNFGAQQVIGFGRTAIPAGPRLHRGGL